jgi:hypothetical protein
MPFNPSVNDNSGQILAQGFGHAVEAISRGVSDYRREQKRKEEEEAAVAFIKQHGARFGLDVTDDKEVRAAVKAAGGGPQAVQVFGAMQQQVERKAAAAQQQQLVEAQLAQMEASKQAEANDAAIFQQLQAAGQRPAEGGTDSGGKPAPRPPMDGRIVGEFLRRGGSLGHAAKMASTFETVAREDAIRNPAPKTVAPKPGVGGFNVVELPGVGKITVDATTGEPIDAGKIIKPDPEKKNDEKALTAGEIQQLQSLQQASRDLTSIDSAFQEIKDKDWGGPVAGRVRRLTSGGADANISRIDGLLTASTPNLARGVFREVGVLTDEDVKRYRALLPDVNDTAAQRKQKLADLRVRMAQQTEETLATLKAAGRDVAGLREKILGDAAKSTSAAPGTTAPAQMLAPDGQMRPIVTVRGQRGIISGGKFYPVLE